MKGFLVFLLWVFTPRTFITQNHINRDLKKLKEKQGALLRRKATDAECH